MWTEKKKDIAQIEKIFDSETILNTEKGIFHSELGTDLKRQKQNIYHSHCLKAKWLSEITLYGGYSIIKQKAFEEGKSRALMCSNFQL